MSDVLMRKRNKYSTDTTIDHWSSITNEIKIIWNHNSKNMHTHNVYISVWLPMLIIFRTNNSKKSWWKRNVDDGTFSCLLLFLCRLLFFSFAFLFPHVTIYSKQNHSSESNRFSFFSLVFSHVYFVLCILLCHSHHQDNSIFIIWLFIPMFVLVFLLLLLLLLRLCKKKREETSH
jgi:cell division protein FtsW (lipid II flippase)